MLGPHAPYTCPPESLQEVITLAKEKLIPIHTHLAETKEEGKKIKEIYNQTPTQYLYENGLFEQTHVLLAHGVHLTLNDISYLKGMNGGVAHNPISNLKLGCGISPIMELINEKITVALGTDGAGSATTLDMFEEIKTAAWLQKLRFEDPTTLQAFDVLEMATRHGATLLNIDENVGTLEVGKKADIILVQLNKPHLQPVHSILSLLAYSANGADVDTTIINGKVVMKNRKLLTIDEEELLFEITSRSKRIVEDI
ncbi:S-adenosylhomocysteine deaminase [Halalkalibacter wakoensis JCM 9140]|uniref:S-adenosylhomocysteine deaminase n=1 Tax=Halalkalibacter wakoensis JCM 9140 TaxID=1236970 RepID=W4Q0D3_9BACI|nr:S-adenosylhomocysteine deaminase [Halalkalibacter wakoensis JCM 9140]